MSTRLTGPSGSIIYDHRFNYGARRPQSQIRELVTYDKEGFISPTPHVGDPPLHLLVEIKE